MEQSVCHLYLPAHPTQTDQMHDAKEREREIKNVPLFKPKNQSQILFDVSHCNSRNERQKPGFVDQHQKK